jgi:hypothetical protein
VASREVLFLSSFFFTRLAMHLALPYGCVRYLFTHYLSANVEQGECARVQGFWKPGVWMPLLVALRRLENGSVCPGLDDLKKRSTAVAVHLAK